MTPSPSLSDLLARYLDQRDRGRSVSPEDLCHDAPKLLNDLRREIAGLASMEKQFDDSSAPAADNGGHYVTSPGGRRTRPDLPPGTVVAGYELIDVLGRGGMAVVYQARQTSLNRVVALKMILAGAFASPEARRRFRGEAEVIAGLKHPHVVQVFECGEYEGWPYFSMELCEGGSLARRLDGGPLPWREAAELVRHLAAAVQAAHDKGVIHRDLKPGNVLLAADGTPKVSDFGLAKQANSDLTVTRDVFGTPSYMPPEQTVDAHAIDHRADVYGLGTILYECLTGRPPFRADSNHDTVDHVRHHDPVSPRRLRPDVPRDLEIVCLKCLEKQPQRRYPSARDLRDDLLCVLEKRPIQARPASLVARGVKWARRRPAAAALIGVAVLAGLIIAGLIVWDHVRLGAINSELQAALTEAGRQQARAEQRERHARLESYAAQIGAIHGLWVNGRAGSMAELLNGLRPGPNAEDLRGFEWHYLWRLAQGERYLRGHRSGVEQVAYSPGGRLCATAGGDGAVMVWETAAGNLLTRLEGSVMEVRALAFSRDGQRLSCVRTDGRQVEWKAWDAITFHPTGGRTEMVEQPSAFALAPDGQTLGVARDARADGSGAVELWDLATGQRHPLVSNGWPVVSHVLRFSPDGGLLAVAYNEDNEDLEPSAIRLFDSATGREKADLRGPGAAVGALDISPDGQTLVARDWKGQVRLWDLAAGRSRPFPLGPTDRVELVAFSPDSRSLATTNFSDQSKEHKVWLRDVASGCPQAGPFEPGGDVLSLAFAPDGQTLALGCFDGLARLWRTCQGKEFMPLQGHCPAEAWALAFAPDGRVLATGNKYGVITFWDPVTGERLTMLEGHTDGVKSLAFAPDGKTLASGANDKTVRLWHVATRRELLCLKGQPHLVNSVAFAPDGKTLAAAFHDGSIRLWHAH